MYGLSGISSCTFLYTFRLSWILVYAYCKGVYSFCDNVYNSLKILLKKGSFRILINNTVQLPRMESQENLSKICLYTGWCFSSTTHVISSYLQGNQWPCTGYSTVDYALTFSLLHLLFLGFQLVLFTFWGDISRWACAVCVCMFIFVCCRF